jgi:hypothetical protein
LNCPDALDTNEVVSGIPKAHLSKGFPMKRIALKRTAGFIGSLILSLATEVRAEVLLAAFVEPSSGRGGITQLNATSLEPAQDFPGLANGGGDNCWIESAIDRRVSPRLYTSSLNGDLNSFDALTGRHVVGIARPDLQWGGMVLFGEHLLAAYTNRATETSNIRVLDPLTLQDRAAFSVGFKSSMVTSTAARRRERSGISACQVRFWIPFPNLRLSGRD